MRLTFLPVPVAATQRLVRGAHVEAHESTGETAAAKERMDAKLLLLQNLLYEKGHIQEEIRRCRQFASKHDAMEVVSEDEFAATFSGAPAELAGLRGDAHEMMKARLDTELQERKRLAAQLAELRSRQGAVEQINRDKEDKLKELPAQVARVLEAAAPVEEYLGTRAEGLIAEGSAAQHLPYPLYVLYAHTAAYCEANDDVKAEVVGDARAAMQVLIKSSCADDEADAAGPAPAAATGDDDAAGDEPSERRRRSTRSEKSDGEILAERQAALLELHPLKVRLQVACGDSATVRLEFAYLMGLNCITVKQVHEAGDPPLSFGVDLLGSLYPDDEGAALPDPTNVFKMDQLGMGPFHAYKQQVGSPYQWAQSIAGLYPTNLAVTEVALRRKRLNLVQVVRDLRAHVVSARALHAQVEALAGLKVPVQPAAKSLFPLKPSSVLAVWKETTPAAGEEGAADAARPAQAPRTFRATLRHDAAEISFDVEVSPIYPLVPPKIAIDRGSLAGAAAGMGSNIRAIEAEVNLHYAELCAAPVDGDHLLAHQVRRVQMCFEVYLETEDDAGKPAKGVGKIFARGIKGRDRLRPFKYDEELGLFVHRG